MNRRISLPNKQSGVVLVIGLIMLLLLTLIGLTGTHATSLEEKMAGNAQDQAIAFQAAEATLLEAEKFILEHSSSSATYTGAGGLYDIDVDEPTDYFAESVWTAENSASTPNGFGHNFVNNSGIAIADPLYVIKKIEQNGDKSVFKITVRAVGISPGTQIILQAFFEKET